MLHTITADSIPCTPARILQVKNYSTKCSSGVVPLSMNADKADLWNVGKNRDLYLPTPDQVQSERSQNKLLDLIGSQVPILRMLRSRCENVSH